MNALPLLSASMLGLPTEASASLVNPTELDSSVPAALGAPPTVPIEFTALLEALLARSNSAPHGCGGPTAPTDLLNTQRAEQEPNAERVEMDESEGRSPVLAPFPHLASLALGVSPEISLPTSSTLPAQRTPSDPLQPAPTAPWPLSPSLLRPGLASQSLEHLTDSVTGNGDKNASDLVHLELEPLAYNHAPGNLIAAPTRLDLAPVMPPELQPGQHAAPTSDTQPPAMRPIGLAFPEHAAAQATRVPPASGRADPPLTTSPGAAFLAETPETRTPRGWPLSPRLGPPSRSVPLETQKPAILAAESASAPNMVLSGPDDSRPAEPIIAPVVSGEYQPATRTEVQPAPTRVHPATDGVERIAEQTRAVQVPLSDEVNPRKIRVTAWSTGDSAKPSAVRQAPSDTASSRPDADITSDFAATAGRPTSTTAPVATAVRTAAVISHERPERTVAERDRAPNYDRPEWQAVRLVPETVAEPTAVRVSAQATETRSADVPSLPEFLATKLTSTDDNQQTLEVQLEPPELGRLVIKLVRSETGLKADFVVSNESARLAVQSELPALQRALEQAGITLNQFNVSQHGQDRSGGRPAQEERDVEPLVRRPNVSKTQAAAPPTMSRRAGSINLRV